MKFKLFFFIVFILSIFLVFVYHDDFLYKKDIIKIIKIKTIEESSSKNSLGLTEKYYQKEITGIYTNGKNKGKKSTFLYEETFSSVSTEQYKVGDKVIIYNGEIEGLKRDFIISILLSIFILSIYLVGNWSGLLSIISVLFNIIIFYIGLFFYFNGINLLLLCILESILFSMISLFLSNGFCKKTIAAVISSSLCIIIIVILLLIVINFTNYSGVYFNELQYLTVPPEDILLPELIIGSVGAIMDVCISVTSLFSELIDKNKKIKKDALKKSSKQLGKDIMSTMSNVLFFTYLCSLLPIFVLAIRNGYSISHFVKNNYSLEITRFLVGSIGIVLGIPVSTYISLKVWEVKE